MGAKSSTNGNHPSPRHVSGNPASAPVVDLVGTAMERLVHAIPIAAAQMSRPVVLIGGLAVVCRLGNPYRATGNVDTVDRRGNDEQSQLELLIRKGAARSGPSGVLVGTSAGPVQIDVLEVTDVALDQLPDDPTGRLHLLAHNWAASTATAMVLQIQGIPPVTVQVAQPGPLIAMKLQSLMDRGAAKEASDLLDILRLTLDRTTGAQARQQLSSTAAQLRADALLHVHMWFVTNAARSLKRIRTVPEGRATTRDDLDLVAELLVAALTA